MTSILTTPVEGPVAWKGDAMARTRDWALAIPSRGLDEIDEALRRFRDLERPVAAMRKEDFPIPSLVPLLRDVAEELENGRGFVQLKGLPVDRYTTTDAEIVYWGLGRHLGEALSQNARGDRLGHVRDEGLDIRSTSVRGYQTNAAQSFHTDIGGDVLGLMCLRSAMSGGASRLASSMTVYNELLRRYPWYVALLYKNFDIDWRGEEPVGAPPVYREPVFSYFEHRLSCRFAPRFIRSAPEKTGVPLSEVELDALRIVEELAEESCFEIPFDPGDVQLINNYVIVHGRTGYRDHPDEAHKRHLLRLWLKVPGARKLPPEYGEGRARAGVPPRNERKEEARV
jgi:hypothetical protein